MKFLSPSLLWVLLLIVQGLALAAPSGQGGDHRPKPERPPERQPEQVRPDESRQRDDGRRPSKLSPEERKALLAARAPLTQIQG